MAIKDDTKRIVVTVELEIDDDGVEDLRESYDGSDIDGYLAGMLEMDVTVKNVLKIEEFGE